MGDGAKRTRTVPSLGGTLISIFDSVATQRVTGAATDRRLPEAHRGHRPAGGATHLGAAHVRAAQGEGRVGAHHERRHRVVRVLVADGESRARRRVSRVYSFARNLPDFISSGEKISRSRDPLSAMGRPETAPLCTNGKPRKTVQESSRVVTRRHSDVIPPPTASWPRTEQIAP